MDDNLTIILSEFEELKGQFVITENWKIERFIAIGTDEDDYYYATYNGREIHWNTCVGRLIPLKGKIDNEHYDELVRIAKLNHFDQPDLWFPKTDKDKQFTLEASIIHKTEISKFDHPNKYLTPICWDLN